MRGEDFLKEKIEDSIFYEIVSCSNTLSDAVEVQKGEVKSNQPSMIYKSPNSVEGFLFTYLGHISANPSDRQRSKVIENTYVIYDEKDSEPYSDYPNFNNESLEKFVKDLIDTSKKEREMYKNSQQLVRDVFILYGPRGCGKTIFVNYLFTKFHTLLDKEKVIWVRIDLTDNFYDSNDEINLIHWLRSQATKIIFRYYLNKHDLRDVLCKLEEYVNKSDTNIRSELSRNLTILKQRFCQRKSPEKIDSKTVDPLIENELLDIMIKEKGYSFIFTLDSFDKIDILPKLKDKFDKLLSSYNRLIDPDTRLGGCFLIITRNETISYIGGIQRFYASSKYLNFYHKELKKVDFERIIEKRLDFFKKFFREERRTISNENELDIDTHIEEFKVYLSKAAEKDDFKSFVQLLDKIYKSNNRKKMQVVQLCYHEFRKERKLTRYKLVETMCKGGYKYPPKPYIYEMDKDGALKAQLSIKLFDNVFLPLVFRYPYVPGMDCNKPTSKTYILCGLRIMQLVRIYHKNLQYKKEIPVINIIEKLKKYFGYESNVVENLIEEFAEYGLYLLKASRPGAPVINSYITNLSPKFEMLLDTIIYDVAYLNMCAMRILVNPEFLKGDYPIFKANSLEDNCTLSQWISWKILNSISLFKILNKIIDLEHKGLESKQGKREDVVINEIKLNDNNFRSQLEETINAQIKAIISNLDNIRKNKVKSIIDKWIQEWSQRLKIHPEMGKAYLL